MSVVCGVPLLSQLAMRETWDLSLILSSLRDCAMEKKDRLGRDKCHLKYFFPVLDKHYCNNVLDHLTIVS